MVIIAKLYVDFVFNHQSLILLVGFSQAILLHKQIMIDKSFDDNGCRWSKAPLLVYDYVCYIRILYNLLGFKIGF